MSKTNYLRLVLLTVCCILSCAAILIVSDGIASDPRWQILSVYSRSADECARFNADDPDCVKLQFWLNYRYYVVRDQDRIVGPPGTPGPRLKIAGRSMMHTCPIPSTATGVV